MPLAARCAFGLREIVCAAQALLVCACGAQAQTSSAPLLQKADLVYEGAFRVPGGGEDRETLNYGGTSLGYNPINNSLFLIGHDQYNRTAEISIPDVVNSANLSDLRTATLLQPFRDATEGRLKNINPNDPNSQKIGGHLVFGDRLIITGFSTYDGAGTQSASHFARPLSLSTSNQVVGPVAVGSRVHYTSAYMTLIPPEWQSPFGGPALTGNCCRSIINYQSHGPALSVFNPDDIGQVDPVPATDLLFYTSRNQLGPGQSTQNPYFNLTTRVEGVVFPNGTRSVLFFGSHGIGPYCYGTGAKCKDVAKQDKGTHAYPYVYQVWAYDANELLQAKSGRKAPHKLRPYAIWNFNLPFERDGAHSLGGAAYDPASKRVYLSQPRGDKKLPIIHVYRLEQNKRDAARPPIRSARGTCSTITEWQISDRLAADATRQQAQ